MRRTVGKPRGSREERFRHYAPSSGDGCWEWQGYRNDNGYGILRTGPSGQSRQERAHRIAWELAYGPVPAGLEVCHECDNPPCIRPGHLYLGTHRMNMGDMARRKRTNRPPGELRKNIPKGEATGRAKVAAADIPVIRERWERGERIKDIAADYGIHRAQVSNIGLRKSWKHIP